MSLLSILDTWHREFWTRAGQLSSEGGTWSAWLPPAALWKLALVVVVPLVLINGFIAFIFAFDAKLLNGVTGLVLAIISFWRRGTYMSESSSEKNRSTKDG